MKYYTVTEAAEILGITERSVARRCLKTKVWKKSNRYQITKEQLNTFAVEIAKGARAVELLPDLKELQVENERLKEELSQYDLNDNERLEVFTEQEYTLFEERLMEWRLQIKEIQHKDKMLELTTKSKDDQISYLSDQLEYQRKLSNKQLEQLEKIFEILQGQNKTLHQLNFINAKDKGYDKD